METSGKRLADASEALHNAADAMLQGLVDGYPVFPTEQVVASPHPLLKDKRVRISGIGYDDLCAALYMHAAITYGGPGQWANPEDMAHDAFEAGNAMRNKAASQTIYRRLDETDGPSEGAAQ